MVAHEIIILIYSSEVKENIRPAQLLALAKRPFLKVLQDQNDTVIGLSKDIWLVSLRESHCSKLSTD